MYGKTIYKNGSRVKATLLISRVLIKDIFNCNFFEWLSQENK